jgi:predicted O-methyltransferase YrrM
MEPLQLLYQDLVESLRAFQESRVLLSAIELDLFTAVGEGGTAGEVAGKLGTDARATEMLLNTLVALGLLSKREGVFHNGPLAAHYLVRGAPDYARPALMHTVHLWDRWSTLTQCVRTGGPVAREGIEDREDDWIEAFIAAMQANAQARVREVVKAVGAEGVRRMLDVGGGSGVYSIAFAQARPGLRAEILDLPPVLKIAQGYIARAGLSDRVTTCAGDLRTTPFGEGYDLVFISSICHMLGPSENQELLQKSWEALAPGGRVVILDFVLEPDKTAPRRAALFALNMLTGTQRGSSYSEPEYTAWLRGAGFTEVQRIHLEGPIDVMAGKRAET